MEIKRVFLQLYGRTGDGWVGKRLSCKCKELNMDVQHTYKCHSMAVQLWRVISGTSYLAILAKLVCWVQHTPCFRVEGQRRNLTSASDLHRHLHITNRGGGNGEPLPGLRLPQNII